MPQAAARVSVLMPTFDQAAFIGRAIESLLAQDFQHWELVVVDDGSPEPVAAAIAAYVEDARLRLDRLKRNRGLGAALNHALELARGELVAYLPSDDVLFDGHLSSLVNLLDRRPGAVLAYSGVRREVRVPGKGVLEQGTSAGRIAGWPLQLVQVMHRRSQDRWLEREELVTDDLDRMFWAKLRERGEFVGTKRITCEWVDHPLQHHKVVREPLGGINPYRRRFRVEHPLRFHSTTGYPLDEVEHYRRFRERPDTPRAADGLTILLVGELAFNAERVLAFEERGHSLYGLWTDDGHWFNTVGPLPFGHVEDLPRDGWREAVRDLDPDVVYALLNWEAVPFAHEVLTACPDVPFVWHFKESPFDCIAIGTWPLLVDLYTRSAAVVFASPEMRDWCLTAVPGMDGSRPHLVLDGDLPKREWFTDERAPLLSASDGEVHTVVAGGPIGLVPPLIAELARHGIHLHFYGDFHRGQWPEWVEQVRSAAPTHFHLHPQVNHDRWTSELSRYDAGWLHLIRSKNGGDLHRAVWGDLNYPARISTLACAGLPSIQLDNSGCVVATQSLARERGLGLFLSEPRRLSEELKDPDRMRELRESVWRQREDFTFDRHADDVIELFRAAGERG